MGFSDNKTAKYPGALGDLKSVMDKLASSVFETSAKTINTGDETYTVPTSTPYAIRLRYVPKETRDGSGNPVGVAIAGMTEIAWSDTAAPSTAQFMVNYLNGEVKFSAASAGNQVQPAYQGVESRVWAESLNEVLRELKKVQEILGINVQGAYATAKDRIIATEGEVQTARAGRATLDDRLDQIEASLTPLAGASPTRKEPSAVTGVLGSAQIELDFDLYVDADTVTNANVKLKDSQDVEYALTLSYDKANRRITGTHVALVDEVYTVYTLEGLRDALGRSVAPIAWSYGVGAAVANDPPAVTNLQIVNPSINGFTAKGTVTDNEGDTITRIDIRYGLVNNPEDPGNLTVQLTGSDIDAFRSVNGKTLNLSIAAGDWYAWGRAAAQLPAGGTQVGDWSTSFGFVVAANARPVVSGLQTLAQSQTGFTAKGAITDNETDPITQLDIVWSQNGSANPDTLFAGSDKVSYTQGADITAFQSVDGKAVSATLAAGDWLWWSRAHDAGGAGSWVRIGSAFNVAANQSPSVSNLAATNIGTTGFDIAGDITEPENESITGVEIQYTQQSDTGWASATTVALTTSTDIDAFRTGVGAATYRVAGTLTSGASMMTRARARDAGSGAYGAWSTTLNFTIPSNMLYDARSSGADNWDAKSVGTALTSLGNGAVAASFSQGEGSAVATIQDWPYAGGGRGVKVDAANATGYSGTLTFSGNKIKKGYIEFDFVYADPTNLSSFIGPHTLKALLSDGVTSAGHQHFWYGPGCERGYLDGSDPAVVLHASNIAAGTVYKIKAEWDFNVNTDVKWYVNGSLRATITDAQSVNWANPAFMNQLAFNNNAAVAGDFWYKNLVIWRDN